MLSTKRKPISTKRRCKHSRNKYSSFSP